MSRPRRQHTEATRHAIAWAAATDAANRAMRAAGRTAWTRDDYQTAVRTYDRLMPLPLGAGAAAPVEGQRQRTKGSEGAMSETIYQVMDFDTGERLDGTPADELIIESEKVSDGAVLATLVVGVWYYVQPSDADRLRVYEKAEVRTVYVVDVLRGAEPTEGSAER